MKLSEFLALKGWSEAMLARELGVTRSTVCYWLTKPGRVPKKAHLAKLRKLAHGAVDYWDFVEGK